MLLTAELTNKSVHRVENGNRNALMVKRCFNQDSTEV